MKQNKIKHGSEARETLGAQPCYLHGHTVHNSLCHLKAISHLLLVLIVSPGPAFSSLLAFFLLRPLGPLIPANNHAADNLDTDSIESAKKDPSKLMNEPREWSQM